MPDIEIRLAQPDDLEAAVGVWERSRWDAQPWLEERMPYGHTDNLRHFRDVVMRDNQVWVAVQEREIVGLLALTAGELDQLYVEPRCQARGIGSALLDRAKELCPKGITLHTHQRNRRARTFYGKRGFRIVKLGVSPAPENEPDVEYAWSPRNGRECNHCGSTPQRGVPGGLFMYDRDPKDRVERRGPDGITDEEFKLRLDDDPGSIFGSSRRPHCEDEER